jgi:hypothetical protein
MLKRALPFLSLIVALSASAEAQERQWSLDVGDDAAYLVFGTPDSDDIGVSLWCNLHAGEINMFIAETDATLKPERTIRATVTVAGKRLRIKGRTQANEESDSISFEAKLAYSDPIFALMLTTDRFKIRVGREDIAYPLLDADLKGLMAACKKG